MSDLLITIVPISKIKPYEKNPRRNDAAVDAVAESIRRFGFRQPIVVDNDMVVVAGHTRLKAAHKLGLKEVPVHIAKDMTPEQAKAYRIADNRTSEFAEWNFGNLRDELDGITLDMDFLKLDEIEGLAGLNADFAPATEGDQGKLDELKPVMVKCPSCGCIHDANETKHVG